MQKSCLVTANLVGQLAVARGRAGLTPKLRRALQDRDATFLFLVVAVHHPFGGDHAFVEGAGLLEQAVDERGLAMVDVGDDGDVAELFNGHAESAPGRREGWQGSRVL